MNLINLLIVLVTLTQAASIHSASSIKQMSPRQMLARKTQLRMLRKKSQARRHKLFY